MKVRHDPNPSVLNQGQLRFPGVPVFVYHGLADDHDSCFGSEEAKYWVSVEQFRRQLESIREAGCRTILLRDLKAGDDTGDAFRRAAVLTFDDGRGSDYSLAFSQLLQQKARAEFFVNTATVGAQGFLTWQEIAEMQRNGMSFQSHAHEHVDLTRLCDAELERQLKLSKQILEGQLGRSVDYLAAPFGQMNHRVIDCALRVGYQAVCSARNLPARAGSRKLNRVVIYRGTSIREFQQLLGCRPWRYFRRLARSPFYRARNLFAPIRPAQSTDRLPEGMP